MAMGEYSKRDIANWFLSKEEMTPKKLQKMMYYAYAWGLVFFNDPGEPLTNRLFPAKFEAWVHGPVDRQLYAMYADYGYHQIDKPSASEVPEIDNADVVSLLNQVMESYGGFSGDQLERLTHQEDPWKQARGSARPLDSVSTVISDQSMYEYFGSLVK